MENTTEHILDDLEVNLEDASKGVRFANFFIDQVVLFGIGMVRGFLLPQSAMNYGISILFSIAVTLLYYGILEGTTGKSIGKMVTGTKAVNEDGTPIDIGKAFTRALCRIIPFEPFSFLGSGPRGWHDTMTSTRVIKAK